MYNEIYLLKILQWSGMFTGKLDTDIKHSEVPHALNKFYENLNVSNVSPTKVKKKCSLM